jgi:hypothetical protein
MDEAQTAFWDGLEERVAACRALESQICASLMKGQDFDDETRIALEVLVFFVTTEFPVSDAPNHREEDAAALIELAQEVSEKFTAFYEVSGARVPCLRVFLSPSPFLLTFGAADQHYECWRL